MPRAMLYLCLWLLSVCVCVCVCVESVTAVGRRTVLPQPSMAWDSAHAVALNAQFTESGAGNECYFSLLVEKRSVMIIYRSIYSRLLH